MATELSPQEIIDAELEASKVPQPTEYQIKQFLDVRMLLAWLYKYCLVERQNLKSVKGRKTAEDSICEFSSLEDLDKWHFWLTAYMIRFMQLRWKGINLADPPPPKLSDHDLLRLMNHVIFEGKPVDDYTKESKLLSSERKVLKELALRLTPNV